MSLYSASPLSSNNVFTLASAGALLYGATRDFLLTVWRKAQRGRQIDVTIKRSSWTSAVMAGRGKKGSFGGIGTATSFGGAESSGVPERGYSGVGSASSQQEYSRPAASSERSGHAGSVPIGSGRGDHVVRVGHEKEDVAGSSAGHSQGRPSRGRGQDRGGRGGRKAMDSIEALGRCMAAILRHRASDYGLEMKNDGFVLVADLLKLSKHTAAGVPLSSHSEEDVRKAVAADGKQRFGLKEESGRLSIRANQGHSIKIVESELLLSLITSPSQIPVCVHGTYERFLSSIWQEGLKRMTRNHVHFATGLPKEDGVISGMRATAQVLIYLNVEKAMADGMKLYISANNVVLTEGFDGVVPTKYFKRVVKKLRDNKEIPLFPPSHQPHQPAVTDAQKSKVIEGSHDTNS